jgi:hypothetical protein
MGEGRDGGDDSIKTGVFSRFEITPTPALSQLTRLYRLQFRAPIEGEGFVSYGNYLF